MPDPAQRESRMLQDMKPQRGLFTRLALWILVGAILVALFPGLLTAIVRPSCISCHTEEQEQLEVRAHREVSCVGCHVPKALVRRLSFYNAQAYHMILGIPPSTSLYSSNVADYQCNTCHDSVRGIVHSNGLIIDHTACTKGIRCTSCHAGIFHESEDRMTVGYSMNTCLRCHQQNRVNQTIECNQCHDGQFRSRTTMPSGFRIVHGASWEQAHGLGDLSTCNACHNDTFCARCHGEGVPHPTTFLTTHGQVARSSPDGCPTCHKDTSICDTCHGIEMPHPQGFLQEHSSITYKTGRTVCMNCHIDFDCNECHVAHTHPGGAVMP